MVVAPQYTSQDCAVCGTRVKKSLSTPTHKCYSCGTIMHRDYNAAIMILNNGLKSLANTEGEEGLIWSGREYLSSAGNCFDNLKIVMAALNAF
jgi:putative transposase